MFTLNALQSLINVRPFTPFRFIMSDGGTVEVPSREMVMPLKNCAIVALLKPGHPETVAEFWTTVWYMHVSRTEFLQPGAALFASPPPGSSEAHSPAA